MITRTVPIVTAALLMAVGGGCTSLKETLFGRGARCGLCSSLGSCLPSPRLGNVMPNQPPCNVCPQANGPALGQPVTGGQFPLQSTVAPPCGCGSIYSAMPGDCGCGGHARFGATTTDPYLGGTTIPGQTYYSDPSQGQTYGPGVVPGQPIQPDDFRARRFDTDGMEILSEDPIPSGARMQ